MAVSAGYVTYITQLDCEPIRSIQLGDPRGLRALDFCTKWRFPWQSCSRVERMAWLEPRILAMGLSCIVAS